MAGIMATRENTFHPILTRQQMADVLRTTGELDDFKGHWRRVREINQEKLALLKQVTTIESTASSTRIEGAELSDDDVARVLNGLEVDSFRARDQSEVLGYGELLTEIYESHGLLTLTENHVKQLHGILLRYSAKDERHRGYYKTLDNHVEARHPDGRTEILFRTASPFETPRLMSELINSTNDAFEGGHIHPLVIIARFIVEFLAIHPFQDGNGRLARALTTLLLLRTGYEYVPYASLERIVEENKFAYYASLRESQIAMREDPAAFGTWLSFFLRLLRTQKKALASKLDLEQSMLRLSGVQQKVLDVVRTRGRATTFDIGEATKIPYRTVRYHLNALVLRGLITAHSERRGRYYTSSAVQAETQVPTPGPGTNGIIADIYRRGKRITAVDLLDLVKSYGYTGKVVGILHGRRTPHLRRDRQTGDSLLTPRGEDVAREFLFTERLASRKMPVDTVSDELVSPAVIIPPVSPEQ